MKRLLTVLLALAPSVAYGQAWSTQQISEYQKALSKQGRFGVPRYATTSLPTCSTTSNLGAVAYDTTTNTVKVCNAAGSWTSTPFGGGITIGSAVTGGGANRVLFEDGSQNLATDADFTYASDVLTLGSAGAGTNATVWNKTMSGSSATSNFFSVTGTMPATMSATTYPVSYQITTAGSSSQLITGLRFDFLAGYTGASGSYGAWFLSGTAGTGANVGLVGGVNNSSAGRATGLVGYALNAGAGAKAGVYATLTDVAASGVPLTNGTAALLANNGAIAADIFRAEDNGTAVFTIADGGAVSATNHVQLTALNTSLVIGGTVNSAPGFFRSGTMTPDAPIMYTDSTANAWHVAEVADTGFDFNNGGCGTAGCTDPNFWFHSTNQATDQYAGVTSAGIYGRWARALSEGSATSVAQVKFTGNDINTGGHVCYTVQAADGTDRQVRAEGCMSFAIRQSGATETCTVGPFRTGTAGTVDNTTDGNLASISAGTLTYTVTCDTTPTNGVNFQINATSSLTQTSLIADGTVMLHGPGQIIRQ